MVWQGLSIPEDAVVTAAHVELTQEGWGCEMETALSLEDNAAPLSFTEDLTPFDRWQDRTDFELPWSWPKQTPGSVIATPDLTAGLQELVDRYGGLDSLVLLESGEGVTQGLYHSWTAYEANPAQAARLYIEWVVPADAV